MRRGRGALLWWRVFEIRSKDSSLLLPLLLWRRCWTCEPRAGAEKKRKKKAKRESVLTFSESENECIFFPLVFFLTLPLHQSFHINRVSTLF